MSATFVIGNGRGTDLYGCAGCCSMSFTIRLWQIRNVDISKCSLCAYRKLCHYFPVLISGTCCRVGGSVEVSDSGLRHHSEERSLRGRSFDFMQSHLNLRRLVYTSTGCCYLWSEEQNLNLYHNTIYREASLWLGTSTAYLPQTVVLSSDFPLFDYSRPTQHVIFQNAEVLYRRL